MQATLKSTVIIRHGLGTGGRTLARQLAFRLKGSKLCLWVKDLAQCLALNTTSEVEKLILDLKKLTDLDVVLIGELAEGQNIGGDYHKLFRTTGLILTSQAINSFVGYVPPDGRGSIGSAATTSNSSKKPNGPRLNDIVEIMMPDRLTETEQLSFVQNFLRRSVRVPKLHEQGLPDRFFSAGKVLNVAELVRDKEVFAKLRTMSDAELEQAGFSPTEVRLWKEHLGYHAKDGSTAISLSSDTFWGLLLWDQEYKQNILAIMRSVYARLTSEEQKVIQLVMFYGLFSPSHGLSTSVAHLHLSLFAAVAMLPSSLRLSQSMTSFLAVNYETDIISFRSHLMVYAWKDLLFDGQIMRSSGAVGNTDGEIWGNFIQAHFESMWARGTPNLQSLSCNRAVLQAVLNFMGEYAIWHCVDPYTRLLNKGENKYSIDRGGACQLQYSFLVEFLFGSDFSGYHRVAQLYEYIIDNLLPELATDPRGVQIDAELSFSLKIRTRYAKALTSHAEAKRDASFLRKAEEVLLPVKVKDDKVFERMGAIERGYLRIMLNGLSSTHRPQASKAGEKEEAGLKSKWDALVKAIDTNSLLSRAETAERWYQKAIVHTNFAVPNPKVSIMQTWLVVLDILRVAFADNDYELCFLRLQTHEATLRLASTTRDLFAAARGRWIFDRLTNQDILIGSNKKYRSADTSKKWNERKTQMLVNDCKLQQKKYQSAAWKDVSNRSTLQPPFEYWIARDLWKNDMAQHKDITFQYSIIATNNKIAKCFAEDSTGIPLERREQLFLGFELLLKIATASHVCPCMSLELPAPDNAHISPYVWNNIPRFRECLQKWLDAVRKPVAASVGTSPSARSSASTSGSTSPPPPSPVRQAYYGLTPFFGKCIDLISTCVHSADEAGEGQQELASNGLNNLLDVQWGERYNFWYNRMSRYLVAAQRKVGGLSFSMLIKSAEEKNEKLEEKLREQRNRDTGKYFLFTGTVRTPVPILGALSAHSASAGVRDEQAHTGGTRARILCDQLSHGKREVYIFLPDSHANLPDGQEVSFYLGISGSQLNAHALRLNE